MAAARQVIVAGAGIAGLTAALALARAGLRVRVLEQAPVLHETGAGIQLGPNASRVLIALGLRERLTPTLMQPQAIRVMSGGTSHEIVRLPLGAAIERRHGAPYWTIHRGDLQLALAAAVKDERNVTLEFGLRVEDFIVEDQGVAVRARRGEEVVEARGQALIGADGIWSSLAAHLRLPSKPRFAHRTAWRALVPADAVPEEFHSPLVHLWLGPDAHLVHYPVEAGRLVNIVGIVHDEWHASGWSAEGDRAEIMRQFPRSAWHEKARALIALPRQWLKWALYERRTPFRGGSGAVTLIGDAAHPMLPFLAQGAGMAIEDAAVLAAMLGRHRDDPAAGLRAYERARRERTARAQEASRRQGEIYGMRGAPALVRDLGMRLLGGARLLARQDWLYRWRPPLQNVSP